mgnify:FL=1|tara:strand:+ start:1005 stop:1679 length:675 start_codon:yes stop_codon:yes gene_type:complete
MRFLNRIFTIKQVPIVNWSSEFPLNTKPRSVTLVMLVIGLFLFGLGEAIIIGSGSGVSPWTVLAQGISMRSNLSIGVATFLISVSILIFWIPLKQIPGIGTVLNAIIIASAIDLTLPYLPRPDTTFFKILQASFGILIVGIGSGIYLSSNLGPGPRDGLMVGLQKKTNTAIPVIRTFIELSAVTLGWFLGGVVGIGTILFVFGVGPCVGIGLTLVEKTSKKAVS